MVYRRKRIGQKKEEMRIYEGQVRRKRKGEYVKDRLEGRGKENV